jgi:predicted phage terminase large subunit-like protein
MLFAAQSYDTAFTESTFNDPTACIAMGIFEQNGRRCGMLLDAWTKRMEYPALRKRVMSDWKATYGGDKTDALNPPRRADIIVLEDKGSGISLRQDLLSANVPVFKYNPGKADKYSRAHAAAPLLELDCIYVMESRKEPGETVMWARDFLKQLEEFPNAEHDDYVDAFTQLMIYFRDAGWLQLDYVLEDPPAESDYDEKRRAKRNPYGG